MKEVRYFYVPGAASVNSLPKDESQHAARVLRMQEGDEMFLMDGEGTFYRAILTLVNGNSCMYDILQAMPQEKAWHGTIHLAIAPQRILTAWNGWRKSVRR